MNVVIALVFILVAGMINGAFALPTKLVEDWRFENIWLQYSIWAFILLPWIAIFILAPQVLQIYAATPWHIILVMMIGGFLFGAGQVGFAFAISMIGIGLSFVICLGLGMGLGFLLPLVFQHSNQILTPFGIITLLGTLFAIAGLIVSTYAGNLRDRLQQSKLGTELRSKRFYMCGVILAITAGLFSAGQNFSFSLTVGMQQIAQNMGASKLGASMIMWPGFLIFTFIPYAGYMLYLHKKNHSFKNYKSAASGKYFLFALMMGAFWFGSLIFYSRASSLIGKLGPIVGWPLFMVLIILTSNFVGWRYKEWTGITQKIKYVLWLGLALLLLSVVILGISTLFHS